MPQSATYPDPESCAVVECCGFALFTGMSDLGLRFLLLLSLIHVVTLLQMVLAVFDENQDASKFLLQLDVFLNTTTAGLGVWVNHIVLTNTTLA